MTGAVVGATGWRLSRFTRCVDDTYLALHVAPMGFSLVLPLLGSATSPGLAGGRQVALLLALAASFHVFAYALNDVLDLPIDRTEPLRAGDPLVRGAIRPRTVLGLAFVQLPVMAALGAALGFGGRGWTALAVAVACLAAYDRWGKSCPLPPLMDGVQGVGWAALLATGVPGAGPLTERPMLAASLVVAYVLLVNGIVGPLRDLPNDFARGARTTAIVLGARPDGRGIRVPPLAGAWALALSAAVAGAGFALLRGAPIRVLGVSALSGVATLGLMVAAAHDLARRRHLVVVGGAWIATSLAFVVLAAGHRATPPLAEALVAAFLLPVLLMFVRRWLVSP